MPAQSNQSRVLFCRGDLKGPDGFYELGFGRHSEREVERQTEKGRRTSALTLRPPGPRYRKSKKNKLWGKIQRAFRGEGT